MGNEEKDIGNAVVDRETGRSVLRALDGLIAEKVMGWVWAARIDYPKYDADHRSNPAWLFSPDSVETDTGKRGMFGQPIITRMHIVGPFVPCGPRESLEGNFPHYSTDIADAMKVVEMFIAKGGSVSLRGGVPELMGEDIPAGHWQVNFFRFLKDVVPGTPFSFTVAAPTLPEAICRAALKATECLSINNRENDGQASQAE